MALNPTEVGDLPQTPFSYATTYNSDQLIAGDLKLVTEGQGVITGGLLLPRGTVLGKVAVGALVGAAVGGNTGNGTIGAISAGTKTKTGVYNLKATSATVFQVTDPQGVLLPPLNTGVAYVNPELNVTITVGGTPFIAGDAFTVTVAAGTNYWKKCVKTAVDGSQNPVGLLVDQADASGGDVNGGVYLTGEFNQNRIAFDVSWTLADLKEALRPWNIYLKPAMGNAAPS